MNKPNQAMNLAKKVASRIRRNFQEDQNSFLRQVKGVIHVGANTGQERDDYAKYGLNVLWIEPIPNVFAQLEQNISSYAQQQALQHLVTDKENVEYTFHISDNEGASSSILPMNLHKEVWPDVSYEREIKLHSTTLNSLVKSEVIDINEYDVLILDTQGSELMVLQGATNLLEKITYIKVEVPDFESYKGCCQVKDVTSFLLQHKFSEISRQQFATQEGVGSYYDIIYRRN